MRVLSLNAWGGALHADLLDYLVAEDADVYCLQEVPRAAGTQSQWSTYVDGDVRLEQRTDLYGELRAALPEHDGFFYPTARGHLIDGAGPRWQEFGLATFVRSTTPVIGAALDFVHGAFRPHEFGSHPRPRNAHVVRLYDYERERATTVAQMHGLRVEAGKGDNAARDAQARAFVELIERVRRPNEPLIVCGDFNVLPESRLFDALAGLGLKDLVTTRGFQDTRTSHYAKPVRFADYLLVSDEVAVLSFDVVESPEVSDHRPLLLTTD
jgi:endonuclease/exonuclease/phosphatase family metal-dependent hydrolase